MKYKIKTGYKIIWLIVFLSLIGIGGISYYVNDQMGGIYSRQESIQKFSSLPYYNSKANEFVSPEKLVSARERTTGGNPGFLRFFKRSPYAPTYELPKKYLKKSDFSVPASPFAVYWLGHSSGIIELDGKRILIDPVFENAGPFPGITKRFGASPLRREDLPDIDVLVITHDHYDHLEAKTIKYLADKNVRFVVPLGVGARIEGWGVPQAKITELGWDQSFDFNGLQIIACPTIHYSGRSRSDKNKTLWASYVIKGKEKKLYWSGDTGYGKHFKDIGDKYGPFDVAFVEIDAWNNGWPKTHLFPNQVINVVKDTRATYLFPIHLATFDLALHPWNESIQKISQLAEQGQIKIITPEMGQKVIPGTTQTGKWWEKGH